MDFNYRVKVLGHAIADLLKMGFAVNGHECKPGEYWVIGCSASWLRSKIKRHKLNAITSTFEAIRG